MKNVRNFYYYEQNEKLLKKYNVSLQTRIIGHTRMDGKQIDEIIYKCNTCNLEYNLIINALRCSISHLEGLYNNKLGYEFNNARSVHIFTDSDIINISRQLGLLNKLNSYTILHNIKKDIEKTNNDFDKVKQEFELLKVKIQSDYNNNILLGCEYNEFIKKRKMLKKLEIKKDKLQRKCDKLKYKSEVEQK
jgi:hypothetical protein